MSDSAGTATGLGTPDRPERAGRRERRPGRLAERIGDVGAVEAHPRPRQRVDVWCSSDRIAGAAEAVGALLVGYEDEEIGSVGHELSS